MKKKVTVDELVKHLLDTNRDSVFEYEDFFLGENGSRVGLSVIPGKEFNNIEISIDLINPDDKFEIELEQ